MNFWSNDDSFQVSVQEQSLGWTENLETQQLSNDLQPVGLRWASVRVDKKWTLTKKE